MRIGAHARLHTTGLTLLLWGLFGYSGQERQGTGTTDSGPAQPIPFSHRAHAEASVKCGFCHGMAGSGESAGFPTTDTCVVCHAAPRNDRPGLRKLAEYREDKAPIPWKRVYELPSYVFFSHRKHVTAGASCSDCHGPVEQRDELRKEKDISMAACVDCHLSRSAPTDCMHCHTTVR